MEREEFIQGGSKDGWKLQKTKKEVTFGSSPDKSWKESRVKNDMWRKRKVEMIEEVMEVERKKRQKKDQAEARGSEDREAERGRKGNDKKVKSQNIIGEVLTRAMVKKDQRKLRPRVN